MLKLFYPTYSDFVVAMNEENLAKHTLVVGGKFTLFDGEYTIQGFDSKADYVTDKGIVRMIDGKLTVIDTLEYSVHKSAARGEVRNDKGVYYTPPVTSLQVGDIVIVGGEKRTIVENGDFFYVLDNGLKLDAFLNVPSEHNPNATDMELNDCVRVPKFAERREMMPESEYANRRACIYDSMKATAARRHMVARACTNHREFDFTVNGVKRAVNYILSMAGKEYKQYLPNEVPSFSEYRNSTVGYNKLINVVIECTKTGYKQRLTLGVIGDKVWVLTDAVRYMRKSLNEGRARHMAMLALTDYDRVYTNQWSAGITPNQQQVSLHLSK